MTGYDDIAGALAPWLAQRLGADLVEVRDVRRHSEGFSWQTYGLTARWRDPADGARREQGFIVRREPEDGLLAPYDIRGQFELHRILAGRPGLPVPRPYWLELDPAVLGMPFFAMERVDGHVPVQWRPDDPEAFPDEPTRRRIGLEFVDALAAIHAVDWQGSGLGFLGPPAPGQSAAALAVDRWERWYEENVLVEVPLVREALGWLRANPAPSGRIVLCHGDYRIGNFVLDADRRIAAILDWELAHIGDPVQDIAYAGLRLFRGRSPLWSQLLPEDEFLGRYEERTGLRVEPETLRFWTIVSHVTTITSYLRACRAFEDGRAGDVRLAAMGHQVFYPLRLLAEELGVPVGEAA